MSFDLLERRVQHLSLATKMDPELVSLLQDASTRVLDRGTKLLKVCLYPRRQVRFNLLESLLRLTQPAEILTQQLKSGHLSDQQFRVCTVPTTGS